MYDFHHAIPVTKCPEASPSEEENDKDSVEDGANKECDANDDFQDNKNNKITIEDIIRIHYHIFIL